MADRTTIDPRANRAEMEACGCDGLSRARLLRRAASAALPGRGLPGIEPGMPTPAGTGLTRRSFVSRTAGLAMAVYGANRLGWDAFEEGIASAAERPAQPVLVSVFLEGGADSLTLLAPTGHPRYETLRPDLKVLPSEGTAFSEDPTLRWHPSASGLATLHGEGKVSVFPAIGYTDANQSHFTCRHFWEVGATDPGGRIGWLGRYLDLHGAPDNPLQGLSLGWELAPVAGGGQRAGGHDLQARRVRLLGSRRVGRDGAADAQGHRRPGGWARPTADLGLAQARGAAAAIDRLRARWSRSRRATPPAGHLLPGGLRLRRAPERAGRDAGRRAAAAVRVDRRGRGLRHPRRPAGQPRRATSRSPPTACWRSSATSRRVDWPTACSYTSGASSAAGPPRTARHRPRRGRASSSDRQPGAGPDGRGVPRAGDPRPARQPAHHVRLPRPLRSLLEQWFGVDAGPIIPDAGSFARPQLVRT